MGFNSAFKGLTSGSSICKHSHLKLTKFISSRLSFCGGNERQIGDCYKLSIIRKKENYVTSSHLYHIYSMQNISLFPRTDGHEPGWFLFVTIFYTLVQEDSGPV